MFTVLFSHPLIIILSTKKGVWRIYIKFNYMTHTQFPIGFPLFSPVNDYCKKRIACTALVGRSTNQDSFVPCVKQRTF